MKLWKHLLPLALAAALLASCGGEPQSSSLPESSAAQPWGAVLRRSSPA